MKIPPTRNHRQLARWINDQKLVDDRGRQVVARVDPWRASTDRKIAGARLRRPGKGRQGLRLGIYAKSDCCLVYRHKSSETYRRHSEAREWVEQNLRKENR
jgi:hypothetical protein